MNHAAAKAARHDVAMGTRGGCGVLFDVAPVIHTVGLVASGRVCVQHHREYGREVVRGVVRTAAAVVVVAGLISGCSSAEPARAMEWQRRYCTELGAWQDAGRALAEAADDADDVGGEGGEGGRSAGSDEVEVSGHGAVAAAKVLDREGLDRDGSHILIDTAAAVGGDTGAERRVVSYCEDSGFETLVG
ncbi:hypothetical protein [Streptomyces sp. NPDC026673]|uniref:hypothetical protein n=1 Tax=Streptomyces sp. NPDC026673 TaxID=3155724 RepID=UPI0033F62684